MHFPRTHGFPVGPALGKADNTPVLKGRCQRMAPRARISMLAQAAQAAYQEAGHTADANHDGLGEKNAPRMQRRRNVQIPGVLLELLTWITRSRGRCGSRFLSEGGKTQESRLRREVSTSSCGRSPSRLISLSQALAD